MRRVLQNCLVLVVVSWLTMGTPISLSIAKEKKPQSASGSNDKSSPDTQKPKQKNKKAKAEAEKPAVDDASALESDSGSSAVSGKTHTVARGPFKHQVELDATVAAAHASAVSLQLDESVQLRIREVVSHGSRVTKGQTLVKFDTTKIDEQIRDLEASKALAELNLKQARLDAEQIAKTAPLDAKLAERMMKHAQEDLARFEKIDRAFREKSSEQNVKQIANFLEYAEEELKQLEKMYKADDLTEETEEIVLKRARNEVDQWKFISETIKYNHDRTKDVFIPRSLMQYEHSAEEATLLAAKARAKLPHDIEREKLEVEKLQFEQKKAADHLDRLKKDRDKLLISSPADGVLYYGRWHANKWTGASDVSNKLHVGNNVQPQDLNLTVVQTGSLEIQAVIPEEDLDAVAPGVAGRFEPKSAPNSKISVKLDKVSAAPQSEGQFGALFTIDGKSPESLVAGMTGKVRVVAYFKADAIAVPTKAVFHDDVDEDKRYVLVVGKGGKQERRDVTVGRENDKSIEITKGLSAGDKILLEKPNDNADN